MRKGKIRSGIGFILGIAAFSAIGQPLSPGKQVMDATFPKIASPGAEFGKRPVIQNLADKVFAEPFQKPIICGVGSFAGFEGNPSNPAFEAVLVQDMSFGDFRVGPGAGGISLDPSGTIQTRGNIAVLDRRMRPAVFQITTDSVRLLEVQLPDVFYLQSREGAEPLAVRPITVYGSGRFLMELRPRPVVNMLRIGGELTILPLANKAQPGEFSAAFQIAFVPVH
jgi:hypothetical protein